MGRFKSAIFDQYLTVGLSQKRLKIGKANRNSYALYRMTLFSMTWVTGNHPKPGDLNLQDWKMTITKAGGGKCRTGKWRTKWHGWKMTDWQLTDEIAGVDNAGLENDEHIPCW